jgi:hypothetical protein
VADYCGSFHKAKVDPDDVLIVPGGKPTMTYALLMFGEPGVEILYPNPGFPIYESLIRFTGASPVPMALEESRGFSFDPELALSQITPRTRLLILNTPANPTGGVVKRASGPPGAGLEPSAVRHSGRDLSRLARPACSAPACSPTIRCAAPILLDGWSRRTLTGWRMGLPGQRAGARKPERPQIN